MPKEMPHDFRVPTKLGKLVFFFFYILNTCQIIPAHQILIYNFRITQNKFTNYKNEGCSLPLKQFWRNHWDI